MTSLCVRQIAYITVFNSATKVKPARIAHSCPRALGASSHIYNGVKKHANGDINPYLGEVSQSQFGLVDKQNRIGKFTSRYLAFERVIPLLIRCANKVASFALI